MNLKSDLNMILQELGETPDVVAVNLRATGGRGVRNAVRFLNPSSVTCRMPCDWITLMPTL